MARLLRAWSFWVVLTAAALLAFGSSGAQIAPVDVQLTARPARHVALSPLVRRNELNLLTGWRQQAMPLEASRILPTFPVTSLDYSDAATFHRDQDGWGGCFHYAALHTMDILNEWRAPYTPDLSFRFLEYMGTVRFNEDKDRAQQRTLGMDGVCTEARLHTNYDLSKLVGTGKDTDNDGKEDQTWDHVLFQGATPKPTAENIAEAKHYRVQMSLDYKPTVATIKSFLCEYGPVWASGQYHYSLNIGWGEGHVIAIVGFDDVARRFKCLNSWGAARGADDYFYLNYDDVERVWHTQDEDGNPVQSAEVWNVRYIENAADDRSEGPESYSARIALRSDKRNSLTIRVGVFGKDPIVVWDRPNRVNLTDWAGDLTLDVPLPDYAADYWPPKEGANPWYLEVTDGDKDNLISIVDGFTLARWARHPHCKSIGAKQVETYSAVGLPAVVADTSRTFYIPKEPEQAPAVTPNTPVTPVRPGLRLQPRQLQVEPQAQAAPRPTMRLARPGMRLTRVAPALDVDLSADNMNVLPGQNFKLTARLKIGDAPASLAGREVTFYWAHVAKLAWRNKPEEYTVVGKATTAADGTASITLKSDFSTRAYCAALVEPDGGIEASSGKLTVGQVVK
jgi:hypothetical protein